VLRGEIGRLTTLMKDLLDFGRPSRLELSEWRLEEVVAQAAAACAELSERRGVGLVLPGDVALPVVLADRQRLTQVLQNLVENAIYFSPPGGTVSLEIRRDDSREEPALEIAVRDSGPGFSSLDLPRLFEPFFSRRRGGTGLGLSIVKRIVEDHGGHVVAENHPEGGAVVRVRLRAVRA
jgi:signal transduction histidine kinase